MGTDITYFLEDTIDRMLEANIELQETRDDLIDRKLQTEKELDKELARTLSLQLTIRDQSQSLADQFEIILKRPDANQLTQLSEQAKKSQIMCESAMDSFAEKLDKKRLDYEEKLEKLEQAQEKVKNEVAECWDYELAEQEDELKKVKNEILRLNDKQRQLKEKGEVEMLLYRDQVAEETDSDPAWVEMVTLKGQLEQEMKLLKRDFQDEVKGMKCQSIEEEEDLQRKIAQEEELIKNLKEKLKNIRGGLLDAMIDGQIDTAFGQPAAKVPKVYSASDVHSASFLQAEINPNSPIRIQVRKPANPFSSSNTTLRGTIVRKPTALDALLPDVELSPERENGKEDDIDFRKRFPLAKVMQQVLDDDDDFE